MNPGPARRAAWDGAPQFSSGPRRQHQLQVAAPAARDGVGQDHLDAPPGHGCAARLRLSGRQSVRCDEPIATSQQCNELALSIGIAINVTLCGLDRAVASQQLHIAETTAGAVSIARRGGDEGPSP
jgi:hypothetical protein